MTNTEELAITLIEKLGRATEEAIRAGLPPRVVLCCVRTAQDNCSNAATLAREVESADAEAK